MFANVSVTFTDPEPDPYCTHIEYVPNQISLFRSLSTRDPDFDFIYLIIFFLYSQFVDSI